MNTAPFVTLDQLDRLARLAAATRAGQRCAFLTEDNEVAPGTLRHFVHSAERPHFLRAEDNVFEATLRVTMASGFERFLPVAEAVALLDATLFLDRA